MSQKAVDALMTTKAKLGGDTSDLEAEGHGAHGVKRRLAPVALRVPRNKDTGTA
ncbi:MAG: hypothetical protein ACM3ON_07265 [Chloroflexota bacterium]